MHADKRGRVKEAILRQLKDELEKSSGGTRSVFIRADWMAPDIFAMRLWS
jgi:hypothetical protein